MFDDEQWSDRRGYEVLAQRKVLDGIKECAEETGLDHKGVDRLIDNLRTKFNLPEIKALAT